MAKRARLMETKETVTFRLTKEIKRSLERAARSSDLNMSEYVEEAIKDRLAISEASKKPDYRAFWAKHPLVPGGDAVLQTLLRERDESL